MSDWEVVNDTQAAPKDASEWEVAPAAPNSMQPQSESLGKSLLKAPFRVGEDAYRGAANLVKNIAGYANKLGEAIPSAGRDILSNPKHALGQFAAGIPEAGQNAFNTPHDIINYLSNRLNLISPETNKKVQMGRMPDSSKQINQLFGKPQNSGEELIRGASRNALGILGGEEAASILNPAKLTAKNIAKDVVNTRNSNKNIYSHLYKNLWDESNKKGFGDLSHVVPNIDIETLRKYSPKKSILGVEDFLKNKTVESAHQAKSDLLKIKRKLDMNTSYNKAEKKHADVVNDAIEDINNNMFVDKTGKFNKDLANKYAKIQQGYANEVVPYNNKMINKYRRNEISPKELVNSLSKGEFMAKRGDHHKAIGIRNKLTPSLGKVGGLAGTAALSKMIYDNMMGNGSHE